MPVSSKVVRKCDNRDKEVLRKLLKIYDADRLDQLNQDIENKRRNKEDELIKLIDDYWSRVDEFVNEPSKRTDDYLEKMKHEHQTRRPIRVKFNFEEYMGDLEQYQLINQACEEAANTRNHHKLKQAAPAKKNGDLKSQLVINDFRLMDSANDIQFLSGVDQGRRKGTNLFVSQKGTKESNVETLDSLQKAREKERKFNESKFQSKFSFIKNFSKKLRVENGKVIFLKSFHR